MSNSGNGNLLFGPGITVVAVLCLWGNEGRFDYYRAAKQSAEISTLESVSPAQAVSYTAQLQECLLNGEYVRQFTGYYRVTVSAEIYAWEKSEDDKGRVSWSQSWESSPQSNERNSGIKKVLQSKVYGLPSYRLGDMEVQSAKLHFADVQVVIPPEELTLSDVGRRLGLEQEGDYLYLRKPGSVDELGDERLHFRGIPTSETATYFGSVRQAKGVGKQYGYKQGFISSLIKNDGMLHHLVNGTRTVALKTIKADFRKLKWTVRLIGTAAVIFGLVLFLSRFLHFIIAIPGIGHLVHSGVWLISTVLGLSISIVTISASMIYHNPGTAFVGLGLVIALILGLRSLRNKTRTNARQRLQSNSDFYRPKTNQPAEMESQDHWDNEEGVRRSYCNLVRLAMADGKLEESENNFLVNWGRSKGLADPTIVELFDQAKRESKKGLEATRIEDLYTLISLAMSDGYLSMKELNHIIIFGQKLGLTRTQVNDVIAQVRKGEYHLAETA